RKNLVETQNENDKRNEKKEEDDDEDVDEAEEKEEEGMKLLREKICFKMLKSIDIYITEIIMKSCFVTVYKMKDDELKWKRADIEGFLYIVKRSIKPYYRLIITNKKNEKHLLQDIDTNMNLSTDQNYIFYRIINEETNVRNIYSLWFYSTEEKEQIYKVLKNIVEKAYQEKVGITQDNTNNVSNMNNICNVNNNRNSILTNIGSMKNGSVTMEEKLEIISEQMRKMSLRPENKESHKIIQNEHIEDNNHNEANIYK
ncbi:asparagine-rich antigen, partial [Plasmodium falciparum RAJ116]